MLKTTQAIKISATWTPAEDTAEAMSVAAFGAAASPASGVRFSGGRIGVRHAVKIDMTDPAEAARVAARIAAIKAGLEAAGTLHTFLATAGAAPIDEVEVLPEQPKAEADAA